jgi:hypothetical protein
MQEYVTAFRTFHTGLIAETHRHVHALREFERHIDVLRHPAHKVREKLAAAHHCWRRLEHLEQLSPPWRDTFRDFKQSLRRVRALLRLLVEHDRRRLGS